MTATGVATFSILWMMILSARAATWHVAGTGSDSADGSEKAPFASLKRAVEAATKAGDAGEIVIHAGVYRGDTIIPAPAASNAPALIIRAASDEEVIVDGGQRITEARPVDAARGIYFLPFHLANFEPSMWEAETRTRYIFAADRRSVETFAGSLAPGRFRVEGEDREGVFFRTSDSKPPSAHDLGLARDRFGLVVRRPNVTVRGLRFRNFQLHFGVYAVSVEAANVTVDSCHARNCYGMVGVGEKIPDAKVLRCTARDVATGVKSYGINTQVEDCGFFRIEDAFVVQEDEQDQCGVQFYTSHIQTARRNLCVGFQAGIFIKASGGLLTLENNTVVASAKGGERGIGPNTWRSGSICRGNVVAGYEEAISTGDGLSKEITITDNLVWLASNPKRMKENVAKITAKSGGENIVAAPLFVDERREDYRLSPLSPGATLGALGTVPAGFEDKTPPTLRLEVLSPARPYGLRSQVYTRKNTWIGGKEPELIEDGLLDPGHSAWITPANTIELRVQVEDTLGKVKQLRFRLGDAEWSSREALAETLQVSLPKDATQTDISVQVCDDAGNWSESATVRVLTAAHPPKLTSKPVITANEHGAIVAFKTDVPCTATLEWGTGGAFDQSVTDPVEVRFRNDNSLGTEWTQHISGPRTDHCLAVISPGKTGAKVSFRLKLGGYGAGEPTLVDEGQFTLAGPARTLHVATTGSNKETGGAKEHPFATIQFAVDRALPGDRVVVAPGVYTGGVVVTHGGVEGHPIRIESAEPWAAVLDGRREVDCGIRLSNVAHVQIRGFEIRWFEGFAVLMYKSQDVLVEGCKCWARHWVKGRPGPSEGIGAYKCTRITIDRNVVFALNSGFRFAECDGLRLSGNTAARCFHRVAEIHYSNRCYLRNNSFAFGSSFLLSMALTPVQLEEFDSDYNNLAIHWIGDSAKGLPAAERLTREEGDFYYGESKAMVSVSINQAKEKGTGTLTQWREMAGKDKHSIFAHPRYADPQNRDFRLRPNSPNIGAGEKGANIGALGIQKN